MSPLRLILGSNSPRRRELLEALRIPYVVRGAAADEAVRAGEVAEAYLERVVLAKLAAVRAALAPEERAGRGPGDAILVADTSVIAGAVILGKPSGPDDARAMMEVLSGRTHQVKTRFALAGVTEGAPFHAETVTTQVTFRALDADEIADYVASGEGVDKAGGYAVQGLGASLVARIDGSYSNVVGLPACELTVALRRRAAALR